MSVNTGKTYKCNFLLLYLKVKFEGKNKTKRILIIYIRKNKNVLPHWQLLIILELHIVLIHNISLQHPVLFSQYHLHFKPGDNDH